MNRALRVVWKREALGKVPASPATHEGTLALPKPTGTQAPPPFDRGRKLQKGGQKRRKGRNLGRKVGLFWEYIWLLEELDPETFADRFLVKKQEGFSLSLSLSRFHFWIILRLEKVTGDFLNKFFPTKYGNFFVWPKKIQAKNKYFFNF